MHARTECFLFFPMISNCDDSCLFINSFIRFSLSCSRAFSSFHSISLNLSLNASFNMRIISICTVNCSNSFSHFNADKSEQKQPFKFLLISCNEGEKIEAPSTSKIKNNERLKVMSI